MSTTRISFLTTVIVSIYFSLGFSVRVDDFRVNDSIPPSELEIIHVLTDYNGKFVVTWHDFSVFTKREVYLKRYRVDGTQIGSQIKTPDIIEQGQRLNTNNGIASLLPNGNIAVARTMQKDSTDSDGNFFALSRVYIDILDSMGNPVVASFSVDTLPASIHRWIGLDQQGLAMDIEGNFTLAFFEYETDKIFFQQFYPTGQRRDSLVQILCDSFSTCDYAPQNLAISMNRSGRFILCWDAAFLFVAKMFYSDGTPVRGELVLACDDTLTQVCTDPSFHCFIGTGLKVGIDSLGNFMAAFDACIPDSFGKHVYARLHDSLGNPLTPNMDIGDLEHSNWFYGHRPRVLSTDDGGYVIVWVDKTNYPYVDIWAKRFDATGNQIGIKYRINNKIGSVSSFDYIGAAISNGHLFVAWRDKRGQWDLLSSVFAQIMPVDEVGVFTPGDINYDYTIDLADLIGMVNYVFKGAGPPEGSPLVIDVTGDCKTNITDLIYMVNHLFKGGPLPVGCPF